MYTLLACYPWVSREISQVTCMQVSSLNWAVLYVIINDDHFFLTRKFRKHWDILIIHLWLCAVPHDWSNSVTIRLHCNYLIHSLHKEITLKTVCTLVSYSVPSIIRPPWDQGLFRQWKSMDNQTNIHDTDKGAVLYSQVISLLEDPLSRQS